MSSDAKQASPEVKTRCCNCGATIGESEAFSFGGSVACEKCVRNYYKDRQDELNFELEARRKDGRSWWKRNRKFLERKAAKKAKVETDIVAHTVKPEAQGVQVGKVPAEIPVGRSRGELSRAEKLGIRIGLWTLVVTVVSMLAALLVVPEFRRFVGLDHQQAATPEQVEQRSSNESSPQDKTREGQISNMANRPPLETTPETLTAKPGGKQPSTQPSTTTTLGPTVDKVDTTLTRAPSQSVSVKVNHPKIPPTADGQSIPNITTGPCSSVQVGGSNNQQNVNCTIDSSAPKVSWSAKGNSVNQSVALRITVDKSYAGAMFAVTCDRPCDAVAGEIDYGSRRPAVIYGPQVRMGKPDHAPNIAAFVIDFPPVFAPDYALLGTIKSLDGSPLTVQKVGTLTIKPQ